MRITPIEIQQRRFKTRLLGYDSASVDQFLEVVADEMERVHKANQGLKEELARVRKHLEEMMQREKTLQETLVTAKEVSDEMRETAKKDAEIIVAEGHIQSERVIRAAEERQLHLIREIQELKGQKLAFETGLRALLDNHMKLLDLAVVPIEGEETAGKLEQTEARLLQTASFDSNTLLDDDAELP